MGLLVIEGDQVGQAGPAFHERILAGPDPLVVLDVPCDGTQDDLLHDVPQHLGQADRPVAPWILLLSLLADDGKPPVFWDLPC